MTIKSIDRRRKKVGYFWERYIEFSNTDWSLIEAARDALTVLDIRHGFYDKHKPNNPKWSRAWVIVIRGRSELQKVADMVPLLSTRKKAILTQAMASYSNLPQYANRRRPSG